ncbi:MAG: hypothetical protein E8D46_04650 [Nitrospira sp.]|nr:MAG: hypothetical protein E8D46_04650 [Nitrospira sp.]
MNQTNQRNQINKPAWFILFCILSVLLATATVLLNMPPLTDCHSEAPVVAGQYGFRATQTVVQPWQGPHHVYGTFSVPDRYWRDRLYTARLKIQGFTEELPGTSPEGGDIDNDRADPGHYIKRVYLPTRTALWFLLTGRFGDLKMPCHWWLVIADRTG